jgi:hypothetical protein
MTSTDIATRQGAFPTRSLRATSDTASHRNRPSKNRPPALFQNSDKKYRRPCLFFAATIQVSIAAAERTMKVIRDLGVAKNQVESSRFASDRASRSEAGQPKPGFGTNVRCAG